MNATNPIPQSLRGFPIRPFLTTAAVAKWLGYSVRTICLWAESGQIPAVKIGRQWRFQETEVSAWVKARGPVDNS